MEKKLFNDTIKMILKMASIGFVKAVVEIGYTEDFHNQNQNRMLNDAIETISTDL